MDGRLKRTAALAVGIVPVDRGIAEVMAAANPLTLLLFLVWVIGVSVIFLGSPRPA